MKKLMCKALVDLPRPTRSGALRWAVARRGTLIIDERGKVFQIGTRTIPFDAVKKANMRPYQSVFFFTGGVFTLETANSVHQFGLNTHSLDTTFPFPYEVVASNQSVPILWLKRMVVLAALAYLFFESKW